MHLRGEKNRSREDSREAAAHAGRDEEACLGGECGGPSVTRASTKEVAELLCVLDTGRGCCLGRRKALTWTLGEW